MSNSAAADPAMTEIHSPDEVVTLSVLYAATQTGQPDPASFSTVRIRVTRQRAADIVNLRHESMACSAPITGLDADGCPYLLDVGPAVAIYVEN